MPKIRSARGTISCVGVSLSNLYCRSGWKTCMIWSKHSNGEINLKVQAANSRHKEVARDAKSTIDLFSSHLRSCYCSCKQ